LFEIEEKLKRKAKPRNQTRRHVFFSYIIWGLLPLISVVLAILYLEISKMDYHSEFEVLSNCMCGTNPAVAIQIEQTNAAATQFFLATTSPTAITPTPSP
jgi:hypothetical protein